jgi:hypothetical protein
VQLNGLLCVGSRSFLCRHSVFATIVSFWICHRPYQFSYLSRFPTPCSWQTWNLHVTSEWCSQCQSTSSRVKADDVAVKVMTLPAATDQSRQVASIAKRYCETASDPQSPLQPHFPSWNEKAAPINSSLTSRTSGRGSAMCWTNTRGKRVRNPPCQSSHTQIFRQIVPHFSENRSWAIELPQNYLAYSW